MKTLFERACLGEPVPRTPVWAMRQAGRWDPEFRRIRAERDFYSFSNTPELAAAASLCPLRFGVDAIILFYDITTLAVSMGQPFHMVADRGPMPVEPIRTAAQVARLARQPDPSTYQAVLTTLQIVRRELPADLPALVFAGAPFTLATYQIGTGKNVDQARRFWTESPAIWRQLLDTTCDATISFLRELLAAGAIAYQLFDSWAGMLAPAEYQEFAQHYHERIFAEVGGLSILFVLDNPYLEAMARSGARVLSIGCRHDLAQLRRVFPRITFQGNVDHQLLVTGTESAVAEAARACLAAGGGARHILNLDHGMDRNARPENFAVFVASAREQSTQD